MRTHVVKAVFKRNVTSYFSGVLGYLFIVAFVLAGSLVAFRDEFFADNIANLNQLSEFYPILLLFLIPAITMSAWADERKLGTDELLFTLPASDSAILIGKYLAVLAVYTLALLFSTTHAMVLAWIGSPDWGVIFCTYLGYWLAGAALLAAGLFASALTSSATVAFVLGGLFCAIPVFLDRIPWLPASAERLSIGARLDDFTLGTIPLAGVLYFAAVALFFLYLNYVVISRRHWSAAREAMGAQYVVRAVCVAVVLISMIYLSSFTGARADMTQEDLYTLSDTSEQVIDSIPAERTVTISAFVSPQDSVPGEYLPVYQKLIGLLRQFDDEGGARLQTRIKEIEPFTDAAEEARVQGIEPRVVQTERGGRISEEEVFLGVQVSSGFDQVVIPFFDVGTPVEYELTRSVGTVLKEERLTVGILRTDARLTGGTDMRTFQQQPEWRIVQELRKQYNVIEVAPDSPIEEEMDVLIAALPSSLNQQQNKNFVDYVRAGNPTLVFADPVPVFNGGSGFQHAPLMPKPSPGGPFGGAPPEEKADGGRLTSLLNALDIAWEPGEVLFDMFNPHPEFADVVRPELVFVTPKGGVPKAFNPDSDITSGLQEIMVWFPGTVRNRENSRHDYTPLLISGEEQSGLLAWDEITTEMPLFGRQLRPEALINYELDEHAHVLAARVQGDGGNGLDVIFVADVDIISNDLFRIAEAQLFGLQIDNVMFVLNAVDVLAGETRYLELRKRRAEHRTLERVEARKEQYVKERERKRQEAEKEADEQLEAAEQRFQEQRQEIEESDLPPAVKRERLLIAQENEQRRLEEERRDIERRKSEEIRRARDQAQREIREIEDDVRLWAVMLPPIPAILIGLIVLSIRLTNEQRGLPDNRMVER